MLCKLYSSSAEEFFIFFFILIVGASVHKSKSHTKTKQLSIQSLISMYQQRVHLFEKWVDIAQHHNTKVKENEFVWLSAACLHCFDGIGRRFIVVVPENLSVFMAVIDEHLLFFYLKSESSICDEPALRT